MRVTSVIAREHEPLPRTSASSALLKGQIDRAQAAYAVANQKKAEVALDDASRQYTRQEA